MTHTLHPEIEEAIDKIKKEYDDYEVGEYDEGDYGYSRGLLRSIQILKDIPLLNDKEPLPESKLLGTDFSKEDDIGCEIYGYVKDNRTVITKVNYVTPYVEEELKQSTPKIDWVYKTKIYGICVCGKDHSKIEKTKDIEATIQLILDKINSLDQ